MHDGKMLRRGFTLIELLVVIAIIAILVSILMPTLSKAKEMAKRASCGSNQRNLVTGCHMYAADYNGLYPVSTLASNQDASAHDLRCFQDPNVPLGLGLLISTGLASPNSMFYCPSLDNRAGMNPGRGMDMLSQDGMYGPSVGTSMWSDPSMASMRISSGYLYRWPSYARTHWVGSENAKISDSVLNGSNILLADHMDIDWGFQYFGHREGLVRFFADGHGGYWKDSAKFTETFMIAKSPPRGGWWNAWGFQWSAFEEELYVELEKK